MKERTSLQEFWDKIDGDSIAHLDEYFAELSPFLTRFLVNSISREGKFVIDIYNDEWEKGSVITYSEPYKQLELRTKKNSGFELVLIMTDLHDQKFVFKHKLDELETETLPQRLQRLMLSVKELGRAMTFYKGL